MHKCAAYLKESQMNAKSMLAIGLSAVSTLSAFGYSAAAAASKDGHPTLVVTMTNDPAGNAINVYDASSLTLLQTLSTNGGGGASGNARGIRQYKGALLAVVNYGSNSVAIFKRDGDTLKLDKVVTTTSAPASIDFGSGHMYVAGATTVDSFVVHGNSVGARDGTASLRLAGGGAPSAGSTAQVGAVDEDTLLVTLKTDPTPGTVDVVALSKGIVTGTPPAAVSAPSNTLTPFGFAVYPDGTAVITLAHSNNDGLFRDGAFVSTIAAGQTAPCWMTRFDKYLFTANTGSHTISRLIGTGTNIFVDNAVAASIPTGGAPSDIDSAGDALAVIDHATASHISVFDVDEFGELSAVRSATVGLNANGVALMPPTAGDE
jgi:hypothetical protein